MKLLKKAISVLLATVLFICILPLASFAKIGDSKLELSVNPYGNAQDSIDTIKWYEISGQYYLFMPSDCDLSSVTVYFDTGSKVTLGGKRIKNGDKINISTRSQYIVSCGLKTYVLNVVQSANIPAMFITTEESLDYLHEDKANKSKGTISTYDNGTMTLASELKSIKGRGNSSWSKHSKKSYNIKFDKKTALLGMAKAKKWTLIASHENHSLLNCPIGWELANQIGLDYTSEYRFADLYINCEYRGTYIVCESVEIGENRINITDLTKETEKVNDAELDSYSVSSDFTTSPKTQWVDIPNNPEDITGGYLIECDFASRAIEEVSYFVSKKGQYVTVKEPEYASQAQVEYISNYWQEAEDAICSESGYNSLGKHYSEYFDVDSLVDMYILLEYSGNVDAGKSSTYFYKDKGGKLVAGPAWDYDTSFGGFKKSNSIFTNDPTVWIANRMCYDAETKSIFNNLYQREEFRDAVRIRWAELSNVFNEDNIVNLVDSLADTVEKAAIMNGIRWSQISTESSFDIIVNISKSFMTDRIVNLNKGFSENAAQIYYDSNGGYGATIENRILVNGDTVLVNGAYTTNILAIGDAESIGEIKEKTYDEITPPSDDLQFAGWNTEKDGSGTTYQPGDTIKVEGTVFLYAQWESKETNKSKNYDYALIFDNSVIDLTRSLKNVFKTIKGKFGK